MQSLGDLIGQFNIQPSERPANSERAYWVEETRKALGLNILKQPYPFRQILGITADWPTEWIMDMYLHCKKSDNFARLWWGLIKKSKATPPRERSKS